MQITVTEKLVSLQWERIFLFQPVRYHPYLVFSKEILHLASINAITIQLDMWILFIYIRLKIARYYVFFWFYVHPSNLSITFARTVSARIARFISSRRSVSRTRNSPCALSRSSTWKYLPGYLRSFTYVRSFRSYSAETEHSSDSHGRSTCYVRLFRRVPFSCTCPLHSLRICSPSSSPFPLHHSAFASLLLIRPRTGRSTRRHDVFHRDVTSGAPARVRFQKSAPTRVQTWFL